jgi:outer membrane protein assembly factor BamA
VPGSKPDTVVLEIEVKEQRTQQARFGVGYSDRTGIVGLVEYSERNWKGRNQTFTVRYERGLGERQVPTLTGPAATNFVISFREPYLDARQTALDVSLYQTVTAESEYTGGTITSRFNLDRLGSAISVVRPLDALTSLTLRLRSERAQIDVLPLDSFTPPCDTNPDDPACPKPPPGFFSPGRTVALSLSGVRDSRDSRIAATTGDRLSLAMDFGLPVLGGDFGFGRYTLEYSRYFPAGSAVVVGRALVGFSHGTLPTQEQFVAGGPSTLRAYPLSRFRANSISLVNLEYRMPLGGLARMLRDFTGVVFVDAGAAPISPNVQTGYGLGIMFGTAVGAIRIDYAFGPEGRQTWLTIGQPF